MGFTDAPRGKPHLRTHAPLTLLHPRPGEAPQTCRVPCLQEASVVAGVSLSQSYTLEKEQPKFAKVHWNIPLPIVNFKRSHVASAQLNCRPYQSLQKRSHSPTSPCSCQLITRKHKSYQLYICRYICGLFTFHPKHCKGVHWVGLGFLCFSLV